VKRGNCPVCGAAIPVQLEYRAAVPVFLNRLGNTVGEALAASCGVLDIVGCRSCGFVWNRSFDPRLVPYDAEYENDQTHSQAFREHMQEMAAKVLAAIPSDEPIDFVEVGCGQGTFLATFVALAGSRLRNAVGFDPAFRSEHTITDPRIRVHKEFFNADTIALLDAPPSLVVTRHTIEHVADPGAFLSAIHAGLGRSRAHLFVETPDVNWILDRHEIEDLFYEHCSLLAPVSMTVALAKAGFIPRKVESVFNGQYLWAEATAGDETISLTPPPPPLFENLSGFAHQFVENWRSQIIRAKPAVVWGGAAKGVTFATLVDPDATRIAALVDINPAKQNKFVPITGHRVVGPETLKSIRPKTVVVMNPNYRDEIALELAKLKVDANILVLGENGRSGLH
jgi:hypothetical protein